MAIATPIEAEAEWTEEQTHALEEALENLNQTAINIADRMDRMHGLMQDIIGDLRAARTGTPQGGQHEAISHAVS